MRNACWAISFLVFSSLWLSQSFFVGCWSGSEVALWCGWCSCPISSSHAWVCVLTRQSDPDGFSLGKANATKYNRNITKQCQTQILLQFPHHGLFFVLTSRRDLWRLSFALGQGRRLSHPSAQDSQSPFYINKYEPVFRWRNYLIYRWCWHTDAVEILQRGKFQVSISVLTWGLRLQNRPLIGQRVTKQTNQSWGK